MGTLTRNLPSERVRLEKPDGRGFDNILAVVQPELIIIEDEKLPCEKGDVIVRGKLPNGIQE